MISDKTIWETQLVTLETENDRLRAENKRLREVLVALRNSTNHSAIVMLISEALGE